MDLIQQLSEYLQKGDEEKVFDFTKQAIAQNIPPEDILNKGLIGGMNVIGDQFRNHEIYLPDVLMAAKAMYAGMNQLKPLLIQAGIPSRGKIVIGTVQGDLHDIGKNLVSIMLKGAGFEIIDLGNDVPAEQFVMTAEKENAPVIGMSALLTTTMPAMKQVTDLVKEKNLQDKIKTIVGGAPLSEQAAKEVGADAYSFDAANAVVRVKELLGVD
ncbi:MAG: cobalamin-binding protein [Candidatus Aminicenantes bacterium]|nr:cobalamin-binding protein [Candidatus Aminicenantes bacterium]